MKCDKCGNKHNGNFGSGRFCSMKCSKARIHSIKSRAKKSKKMKGTLFGYAKQTKGKLLIPLEKRICIICQSEFFVHRWRPTKTCNRFCAASKNGGLRTNSGKKGSWYYCKWMDKNVYLDSTWEKEYVEWLDKNQIEWTRPSYFDWIDVNGKNRKYYPDFYLVRQNLFIDVKNDFLINRDEDKISRVLLKHKIDLKILSRKDLDLSFAGVV